nr:MAG TPA: hypothetical protein [Caudoviricetes sp.]DAY93574.1 MAG TPA: hypothetical protein [Caudoviricetes sp.]
MTYYFFTKNNIKRNNKLKLNEAICAFSQIQIESRLFTHSR